MIFLSIFLLSSTRFVPVQTHTLSLLSHTNTHSWLRKVNSWWMRSDVWDEADLWPSGHGCLLASQLAGQWVGHKRLLCVCVCVYWSSLGFNFCSGVCVFMRWNYLVRSKQAGSCCSVQNNRTVSIRESDPLKSNSLIASSSHRLISH